MKKRHIIILIFIGLVIVVLGVCAGVTLMKHLQESGMLPEAGKLAATDEDRAKEKEALSKSFPYEDSTGKITFTIFSDWMQADGTEVFYTADKKRAYGLNGISELGSGTAQDFFSALVDYYKKDESLPITDVSDSLSTWVSKDGVTCETGMIYSKQGRVHYDIAVIIAPSKNLVLTFSGQTADALDDRYQEEFEAVYKSVEFLVGKEDEISGKSFLNGEDGEICLNADKSFQYYKSKEDHENNYYAGSYEVYYGQEAIDQVAAMSEYKLTADDLEQVIQLNMNGYVPGESKPIDYAYATGEIEDNRKKYQVCKDIFYAVILHNQLLVTTPEESEPQTHDTVYVGYYITELSMADFTNLNTFSHTTWTLTDKTE